MTDRFKISSIVIAKNEELNIKQCIDSQVECIDNIIVLIDSKTSDRTLEIVKSYSNVSFEVVDWMGYSKTKQYAVSKTKYDWVLWIDADERVTGKLSSEINLFKGSKPLFAAYKIGRRAYFLNKWIKHSGWYPGYVTRLFNKHMAAFSDNDVHEHLVVKGKTGQLKNDLEHFTDPSIRHYFEKFNNYTTLAAEELFNKNAKAGFSDLFIRPVYLFVKMFILKKGFLDGLMGFVLAIFSATYVFVKYLKLWELNNLKDK